MRFILIFFYLNYNIYYYPIYQIILVLRDFDTLYKSLILIVGTDFNNMSCEISLFSKLLSEYEYSNGLQ